MNNLVIYLIDEDYREEIVDLFEQPQYHLKIVPDLKQVIATCQTDLVDLLLIWPATILAVADLVESILIYPMQKWIGISSPYFGSAKSSIFS